eukprot:366400-Chlamydomonas_euryale.AAC.22
MHTSIERRLVHGARALGCNSGTTFGEELRSCSRARMFGGPTQTCGKLHTSMEAATHPRGWVCSSLKGLKMHIRDAASRVKWF